jgi:hypothetical protein
VNPLEPSDHPRGSVYKRVGILCVSAASNVIDVGSDVHDSVAGCVDDPNGGVIGHKCTVLDT